MHRRRAFHENCSSPKAEAGSLFSEKKKWKMATLSEFQRRCGLSWDKQHRLDKRSILHQMLHIADFLGERNPIYHPQRYALARYSTMYS